MKKDLEQLLDKAVADAKAINDVRKELAEASGASNHTKSNENAFLIPDDISITVITKAFFKEYFDDVGFGTFKVMVALGKVTKKKSGYIEAEHGFSTLYYDNDANFVTSDFHVELR